MNSLDVFDDARLNADLTAILCLRDGGDTPPIHDRPTRRRSSIKNALRSPQASATIGLSFFIAMLGTTAFLMYRPSNEQSDAVVTRPSAPRPAASKEASNTPPVVARIEDSKSPAVLVAAPWVEASHGSRQVRPAFRSRRKVHARQSGTTTDVAATGGAPSTPVVAESRSRSNERGLIDLAQNTSPVLPPNVEVSVEDRSVAPPVADHAGADDRSARVRRNSVAAIRALRRQW